MILLTSSIDPSDAMIIIFDEMCYNNIPEGKDSIREAINHSFISLLRVSAFHCILSTCNITSWKYQSVEEMQRGIF